MSCLSPNAEVPEAARVEALGEALGAAPAEAREEVPAARGLLVRPAAAGARAAEGVVVAAVVPGLEERVPLR